MTPEDEPARPKPVDLGEPLVENADKLKKLDRERPLWLDAEKKRVVMLSQVCQTEVPLEMFACLKDTKEHEAVLSVPVKAFAVHAALLALGAKPGNPVQFDPNYKPATGPEVEITLMWKDQEGKVQTARAQDWIKDVNTGKAMAHVFVFGGSGFWEDVDTKQKHYMADGGDFICVSNFSTAMLDLPVKSTDANAELQFQAFKEHIPPRGTPVTMILAPKLDAKPAAP
jgi:hypothetical protein